MVTSLHKQKKAGNILDLMFIREIKEDCLISKKKEGVEYRAVLKINPVNFSLMSDTEREATLESFRVLLQRLEIGVPLSIHIRVLPYDISPYLQKLKLAAQETTSDASLSTVKDHEQFIRSLSSRRAILQREFYIRLVAPAIKSKDKRQAFEQAKDQLHLLCEDVLGDIQRCGLSGRRLNDIELAQYYSSCVHLKHSLDYPLQEASVRAIDKPIASYKHFKQLHEEIETLPSTFDGPAVRFEPLDFDEIFRESEQQVVSPPQPEVVHKRKKGYKEVTPYTTLVDLIQPAHIVQNEHFIKVHHDSTEFFRGRSIEGYPAVVIGGWLDRLIQIEEPYTDLLFNLKTLDPKGYTNNLTRQITGYRTTQELERRNGKTENPYIEAALEEVELLRTKLVRQIERVHAVSLYICVRGSSIEELKARDEKMTSLLRSLDLTSAELSLEHLEGWQSILPDASDLLKRRKILDTSSAVTAFPFASTSLSTEPGFLLGIMPNGSPVIVDPASPTLDNGHEIVFARSGAGKSYDEKLRLGRASMLGFEIVIIDPEDEYIPLCRAHNGINIRLSSGALQLNPFDLPLADTSERDILKEQFQSLLVLFDLLLAEKTAGTLSQKEKAFLQKCLTKVYEQKGITSDYRTHKNDPPSMHDFYHVIVSGECGEDAYEFGDRLAFHLDAFSKTSVDLSDPFVVFNIRDLSDTLKPVGLFLITDHIWKKVRSEKHPRRRILAIDEAWILLEFPEGGRFLASLARRARKYNLCLRVVTQNVEDFLGSEAGRTILANAAMKFLMKQDASTIDAVSQAFKLSDGERSFLLSCNRGEGLFFCGLSHVPLQVIASESEHKLATTNQEELLKREKEEIAYNERLNELQEAVGVKQRNNEYDVIFPQFYQKDKEEE